MDMQKEQSEVEDYDVDEVADNDGHDFALAHSGCYYNTTGCKFSLFVF